MEGNLPVKLEHYFGKPQEDPFQWIESFELFIEMTNASEDRILRLLKYALKEDAYRWLRANEADLSGWEDCKRAFLERFGYDEDTITTRLYACCQSNNETVRSYADRLRNLICYLSTPLPPRMSAQMFVKGLIPPLRERVQMMCPADSHLGDLIRLAAHYEQIFGLAPLGSTQERPAPPPRQQQETQRYPERNPAPPARQDNNPRQWNNNNNNNHNNRNRDFGERKNNQQLPPAPVQQREIIPAPPAAKSDVDALVREMERMRLQLAELQKPAATAHFTQFEREAAPEIFGYEADAFANKRAADNPPEMERELLRRRPNNVENTAVDPDVPFTPAPQRPQRANVPPAPAREPAPGVPPPPQEAPRRAAPARPPVDLGGLPPFPERPAYRRAAAAAPIPAMEPLTQIKASPLKMTIETFLNHVSEEEFQRSMQDIQETRRRYVEGRRAAPAQPAPVQPAPAGAALAAANKGDALRWKPMEYQYYPSQNLQRNPVSTTVATVPIILNSMVFEDGVIDTGATNTMISQTTARQLDLLDSIEPCRVKFTCADGKAAAPWGLVRRVNVGVEGLSIPLDVYVSGATTYDVLLGTDWLTQARAEISFDTSEMSFRIDNLMIGKIPIMVTGKKNTTRYCAFAQPLPELLEAPPPVEEEEEYEPSQGDSGPAEESDIDNESNNNTDSIDALDEDEMSEDLDEDLYPLEEEQQPLGEIYNINTVPLTADVPPPPAEELHRILPETNDLMLVQSIFNALQKEMGPFDVDACCTIDGANAHVENYWSPVKDCLTQDWTHLNVYCHPPPTRIKEILEHCLKCFWASPGTTNAAIVVPDWPQAPWYSLINDYFEDLYRHPEPSYLFTAPGFSKGYPRIGPGPTEWPYLIVRPARLASAFPRVVEIPLIEDPLGGDTPEVPVGDHLSPGEKGFVQAMVRKFTDVFTPGAVQNRTTLMHHRINTGEAAPIQTRPYRLSRTEEHVISAEVEKMLQAGVIVPSSSPWSSAPVLVSKPDGSVRFCIDYRPLNAVTVRDNFPMPRVDETLDAMAQGVKFLSKIDCKAAFWLIPIAPEDRAKTAFITKGGLYEFVSMPFGLKNAPATLQRFVNMLLADLIGKTCVIYLDDCLVFSKTFEEHLHHLEEILLRFRAVGFRANPAKCELFAKEVLYLGHVLTPEGVRPNPAKVQAIKEALPPKDVTGVRSFLGLVNYYRRYLPNMAAISTPLTHLTRKDAPFEWTPECSIAFKEIKQLLINAPLLKYPNFDREFILYTDWQPGAVAAILGQEDEIGEYVIAYASRTLTGAALNYSPTDGELFAVVWAVRMFRPYLYGTHFRLLTDHKALQWLRSTRNLSAKLARYAIELQEYDFDVQHRAGSQHANVDGLSRLRQPNPGVDALEELDELPDVYSYFTQLYGDPTESEKDEDPEDARFRTPSSPESTDKLRGHDDPPPQAKEIPPTAVMDPEKDYDNISEIKCRVCDSSDDEELMLLCDCCNAGFHIDCLDPPLSGVPRGPWNCTACLQRGRAAVPTDIAEDYGVLHFLATGKPPEEASTVEARRIRRRASNYYFDTNEKPFDWTPKHVTLMKNAGEKYPPRIVPWKEDRLDIIKEMHDTMGHYGIVRTFNLVKERYYWQGMYEDVLAYVKYCPTCQMRTASTSKTHDFTPVAVQGAFHTVGIDITGPFTAPKTRDKKYIVVCIDYLTKWVEAQIIPNKSATTTATFFKLEIIARHGCPLVLISDNGREWDGEFSELIKACGIEHRRTSPYHPQANGLVERFNGTLKVKLQENVTLHPTKWVERFPDVLLGYRSTIQESTKFAPFQLLYGRQAVLPTENYFRPQGAKRSALPQEARPPAVEQLHSAARGNVEKAQERQKLQHRKKLKTADENQGIPECMRDIKPGDLLLVKNRKPAKSDYPYIGPYHFVKWHSKYSVVLRDKKGKEWIEPVRDVAEYREYRGRGSHP
jgi:transposase InsO family protein